MSTITDEILKIGLPDLTTGTVGGSGTFDGLMVSVKAHLMEEFNAGRITGGEYTKAYIALVQVAMTTAVQFLLGRDQAYWAAVVAQKNVASTQYSLDYLLPAQLTLVKEQGEVQRAQTLDTRSDTIPVAGSVKSQKDLYAQQIISYQRSSQTNAAKVWVDSWVADSALQDSPTVPTGFTSTNIGSVLTTLKTTNGL
jgi:hypothetical protein